MVKRNDQKQESTTKNNNPLFMKSFFYYYFSNLMEGKEIFCYQKHHSAGYLVLKVSASTKLLKENMFSRFHHPYFTSFKRKCIAFLLKVGCSVCWYRFFDYLKVSYQQYGHLRSEFSDKMGSIHKAQCQQWP